MLSKAAINPAKHVLLANIVHRYAVAPSIIIVRTAERFSNTYLAEAGWWSDHMNMG